MLSREDYVKYFIQIRKIERAMHDTFGAYAAAVDDPKLKKFFLDLQRQEKAHARLVDSMLETFGYREP